MSEQASGNFISVSERLKRFKPASGRRTVKHYPTGIKSWIRCLAADFMQDLLFSAQDQEWERVPLRLQIASEIAAAGSPVLFYSWRCHLSVWRQKY